MKYLLTILAIVATIALVSCHKADVRMGPDVRADHGYPAGHKYNPLPDHGI